MYAMPPRILKSSPNAFSGTRVSIPPGFSAAGHTDRDWATKDFLLPSPQHHNSHLLARQRVAIHSRTHNNSPLICKRATGWNGPLELAASTTILLPALLHVNI